MSIYCAIAACSKPAQAVCGRCNLAAYCSKQCQVLAFPQHSKHCFELPSLVDLSAALINLTVQGDSAEVTPFNLSLNTNDTAVSVNTEQESVKPNEAVQQPTSKPVAAQSVVNGKKPDTDVKESKKEQPPIKVPFDQGPRSTPPIVYKEPVKTVPNPSKGFVVDELKQPEKKPLPAVPLSMNKLRMSHQALKTPPEPVKAEPPRIELKDLNVKPLPKENFNASPLTGDPNTKVFFITECIEEINEYLQLIEATIAAYVESLKVTSYKPTKNEVVLAKFEDRYYRAHCRTAQTIDGIRQYSVQFIDYGDIAQVAEADIRPFDKSLMFDIVTHSCLIDNCPEDQEKLVKIMEPGYFELKDAKESDGAAAYTASLVL